MRPATRPRPFAGSAVDHGPSLPVPQLVEDQAARTPDRPALSFRNTTLSYRELDRLAEGLAADLTAEGLCRGDVVAVAIGNSLELPLCLLALLKLGAVFVPCDPAWPAARTREAMDVLTPRLVLTTGGPGFVVDAAAVAPREPWRRPAPEPGDAAYGVFTSGTTGRPKCAINTHGGLANRFRFMTRFFGATAAEVVLQNSRHTFDSALWQLLWPLTSGGHTVVPDDGEFLDLEHTVATIERHGVTMTDFVPATLAMLVALLDAEPALVHRLRSLRQLVVGGEQIGPDAVHRLRSLVPGLAVANGYGPSEAAIGMVFHQVTAADGDRIPLGRPIDNCYAVVVGEKLEPLPPGEIGEIVIGGACLGTGYLGDPVRTAELFVRNPFPEIPGDRVYRTGDLGWFDDAGLLRFSGRGDEQLKVAGVRIEPGELETAAQAYPGIRHAKAFTAGSALAVAAVGHGVRSADLRAHLAAVLPRAVLPRHCLVLPALPLTEAGKVDVLTLRALIAAPAVRHAGEGLREEVAKVFGRVLDRPDFGVEDDFLALGGDSLCALAAVLELRALLGSGIGVQDLYEHRRPAALVTALRLRGSTVDFPDEVLMEQDALLGNDLLPAAKPAVAAPRTVFVTGGTGFAGVRVVHQLLAAGVHVVCLVRAEDRAHAMARMTDALQAQGLWDPVRAPALEAWAGDLGKPRFGLAEADWAALARRCDAVCHLGALVNFLFDYRAHRAANVLGTVEVLRFALEGRTKPLHHVSTLGVLERQARASGTPVPEDFAPARALAPVSGYSRSKWVAERILAAARERGAPVTVYRLGELMPASDNGRPHTRALTHLLLTAFHRLGVRPDVPMRTDYTPVDEAAARLVAAVRAAEPPSGAVHVFHGRSVDLTLLPALAGTDLPAVPEAEFLERLRGATEHATLAGLLAGSGLHTLLTDNPALFTRDACVALDRRHGLDDGPLAAAVVAYHRLLAI